ncbi:MAG: amino acid permease, partial [Acidimicrobiia bacterium]|nr:amino acid permease [Acidimicrobiia bacterium]
ALVFFAFVGFDEVITLGEETESPTRVVPLALFAALAISTLLYVGVALSALSVLGPEALAASRQPLADVVEEVSGPGGARAVSVVALLATTNTSLLALTAASRVLYGMAVRGALPAGFARLNRRAAPAAGLTACAVIAGAFVALGDLELVAAVTDVSVYAIFVVVHGTLILLRIYQPDRRRPFRVPWAIGPVPLPVAVALVTIVAMVPFLDRRALGMGFGLAVLGAVLHAGLTGVGARRKPSPAAGGAAGAAVVPSGDEMRSDVFPRRRISTEQARAAASELRVDFLAVEYSLEEFRRGMEVELEHGRADPDTNISDDDLLVTAKIALAHLNEIPDYYTRLAEMERAAADDWRGR